MKSSLYIGTVKHERYTPLMHSFSYQVVYYFLNLDRIPEIFNYPLLFSHNSPGLISFWDKDYLTVEEIRKYLATNYKSRPIQTIYLLTNVSYLGFCFNPVSFYYCYDDQGELAYILSHITNTPWGEKHLHVTVMANCPEQCDHFPKQFHVSPFMPMEMDYSWSFGPVGKSLWVCMQSRLKNETSLMFQASLNLEAKPLNVLEVTKAFLFKPMMTLKTVVAIYWQALILFLKKVPFYTHPKKRNIYEQQ